ncbi:hypothetical protein [Streptomyces natalensis]|uniref:Uncharacterized protein n=1 Tax=Streptomyces natalensis ATCC 27448 TaxID=1240678 RepID=A0A0D7CMV8_9ACTN|nr:hypothetical protein [Streptomyces natalensis]KIZ17579.1 hypothetical protein SNA_13940 [Streptomyces natalensis ATCC 27448]
MRDGTPPWLDPYRTPSVTSCDTKLHSLHGSYSTPETPELSKLAFIVERTHADFMTALEATLSGYFSVASDAMRDVLEIQYLLMDFAINPGHADDWLTMLIEKAAPGSRAEDEIKKDMTSFDEARRQAETLKQVWLAIPEARVKLREGDPATAGSIIIGAMVGSGILDRELIVSAGDHDAVVEALIETMHQLAESGEPVSRAAARVFLSIAKSDDTTSSSGQGEQPRQ